MTRPYALSAREQEVVDLLLKGKSNKLIASALGISDRTVEFHLKNIFAKLQVNSRTEAILKLGTSTVAGREELPENSDSPRAISLREAISRIGKELKMENLVNPRAEADPATFFGQSACASQNTRTSTHKSSQNSRLTQRVGGNFLFSMNLVV